MQITIPIIAVLLVLAPFATAGPAEDWLASGVRAKEVEMLKEVDRVAAAGPFTPNLVSLEKYEVPDWYRDAKFGIFIHWGVYSVPAFGSEWYPRNMYLQGDGTFEHHVKTYGPQKQFGYKDFIPMFKAEKFDAGEWADLFGRAGAKYVVPVAEHHDGFAMYDSALSDWTAAKMGPRRDVIGELAKAVRGHGMTFGLSSHRAEHWWFLHGGTQFDSDVKDSKYAPLYGPAMDKDKDVPTQEYTDDWLARTAELVDKYHPQLVYFDWWIEEKAFEQPRRTFAAYYYNRAAEWGKGVAINYKNDAFPPSAAVYDIERGQLSGINPRFWQTDTSTMINSWGHVSNPTYKSADALIDDLIDVVSKNGTLLLNVGPRADGSFEPAERQILLDMGAWLGVNGEAIYGTRPFKVFGEGPTAVPAGGFTDADREAFTGRDVRFTARGDVLYAVALAWPGESLTIRSLAAGSLLAGGEVKRITLLGREGELKFSRDGEGLKIDLSTLKPAAGPAEFAYAFRIEGLTGLAYDGLIYPAADGSIALRPDAAVVAGPVPRVESKGGLANLGFWTDPSAAAVWKVKIAKAGTYALAAPVAAEGASRLAVSVGGQLREVEVPATGGYDQWKTVELGRFTVDQPGEVEISVRPADPATWRPVNLAAVQARPVE